MRRFVFVTGEFEGYHKWADAPEEVKFLRNMHRHIFKVRVDIEVFHNDREIEFVLLKRVLKKFLRDNYEDKEDVGSCEMICENILKFLENKYKNRLIKVEVSEDGENGAIITNDYR